MGLRTRFALWTALMLGVAALFLFDVHGKLTVETDILALLPADERDPALDLATRRFSEDVSRKTLFLVGAPTADAARSAAIRFAGLLRAPQVFGDVQLEVSAAADATALYRGYRHRLLSDQHRAWLAAGQGQDRGQMLFDEALRAAYGLAGLVRPLPLAEDPFNLFGDYLLGQLAGLGAARPQDGMLMASSAGMTYVLVTAESKQAAFSIDAQERLMPVIESALAQTRALPGVKILTSGVILHASAASKRAQAEISTVGTVSMIGVLLLVWLTFRSLLPLVLSVVSLGAGALAAITACHYIFDRVHLVTLVFGSSLIGVAIDYSMHFLADQFRDPGNGADDRRWSPAAAIRHVGPGIAMGMNCGVLGYLALMLAPLPGLRQMAVFAAVGLAVSCGCVLFWYPLLTRPMRRNGPPLTLRLAGVLDRALQRRNRGLTRAALLMLAVIAAIGLWKVRFIDDVRLLQASPPALLENERAVREVLHNTSDSRFFVVRAATPQAVLEVEEQLGQRLDTLAQTGVLASYTAISRALPSLARQAENRRLLADTVYAETGLMPRLLAELGFPPAAAQQQLAAFAAANSSLSLDEWLASPISAALRPLWLGAMPGARPEQAFGSIVALSDVTDAAALQALSAELPAAQLIDKVDASSQLMTRYRRLAALLIAGAYLLIGLLLAWRYGLRAAPKLLAVPVCAALLALSLFGWLGTPANLFNVLALFMVLGLGVDYAVFLREGRDARAATVLALTLTTLGTLLAYGLLAFSSTPFIHSIGLTLLVGIGFTYVFALLSTRPANAMANGDNGGRSPQHTGTRLPPGN